VHSCQGGPRRSPQYLFKCSGPSRELLRKHSDRAKKINQSPRLGEAGGVGGVEVQFHTLLTSAGKLSAARPGRFTTRAHWTGGHVGSRTLSLGVVAKRKMVLCLESNLILFATAVRVMFGLALEVARKHISTLRMPGSICNKTVTFRAHGKLSRAAMTVHRQEQTPAHLVTTKELQSTDCPQRYIYSVTMK
jgi:hypothetical protein